MIDIKKEHIDFIKDHAQRDYPYECCGIIVGKFNGDEKTVTEIIPIINEKEEENRHNRYLIPSKKVLEAELYAIKNGLDIVGFYHSHPDHNAIPSAYDIEHALPVYSYLIVSVFDAKAVDYTISVLSEDRLRFKKELIKG